MFSAFHFLVLLVFSAPGMKFPSLATMVNSVGGKISRVALHKKFSNASVKFLKEVLKLVFSIKLTGRLSDDFFKPFSKILIFDSSTWQLNPDLQNAFPGHGGSASNSMAKLQLAYDFLNGQISFCDVFHGCVNDAKCGYEKLLKTVNKGSLVLADLGYYSALLFKKINDKKAFFVSRVKSEASFYDPETNKRVSPITLIENAKTDNFETDVVIKSKDSKAEVQCRLVCIKAPKQVAEKRIREKKRNCKKRNWKMKKATLFLCGWTLMITNVPKEQLPAEKVFAIYRIRWQIELIFKQFKSTFQINKCNTKNKYRLLSEIYGKLILCVIVSKVHGKLHSELWNLNKKELSFNKFCKNFQFELKVITNQCFHLKVHEIIEFLEQLFLRISRISIKLHQKSRLTSLQNLVKNHIKTFLILDFNHIKALS